MVKQVFQLKIYILIYNDNPFLYHQLIFAFRLNAHLNIQYTRISYNKMYLHLRTDILIAAAHLQTL